MIVAHRQRAADIVQRIRKFLVADAAAVQTDEDVFVQRPAGLVARQAGLKADRADRIERADELAGLLAQRAEQLVVQRPVLPLGLEPAGRPGARMLDPGVDPHRLTAAVGDQVQVEQVVLQRHVSLAVIHAVGESVMRERDIQTADHDIGAPNLPVEIEGHVGVDPAGRPVLLPLILQHRRQHVEQLAIQLHLPNLGLQRQGARQLEPRTMQVEQPQRGLAAVGDQFVHRKALVGHAHLRRMSVSGWGNRGSSVQPRSRRPERSKVSGDAAAGSYDTRKSNVA